MRYVALIDREDGAYGASFPDAPGCAAMGVSVDEAVDNAGAALEEWCTDELAAGRQLPVARSMDALREAGELMEGGTYVLLPLVMNAGRAVRANISLDAGLLQAIDEAANRNGLTRSSFLASAAREKIAAGR